MNNFHEVLKKLIIDACRHPPKSWERQEALTQIIRLVMQSGKLWQENTPYYEDAQQQMWLYFCRNVCEATTTEQPYDPTRSSLVTWLDNYLKRRLQDFWIEEQVEKTRTVPRFTVEGKTTDPLANIPAPSLHSPLDILEATKKWVNTDSNGELRRIHLKGHPQVTCQMLLWRRLPPRTPWKDLSAEFGLPISTLDSFYRRQCLPRLRKFGEFEGYL
ncbi:hypothetical protein Cylst_1457 [Cylindrospermum stagnale PCC 7417]|uniref:Sigma-70 family RNA polymerase sigma factor n=1 Tax=Cylindrospermum stagnale PCC 7417 TaxID=56107 RepID=K9WVD0_9NOST|nr:hypothetical protein [Cylindrospermum stagnale]AFZ23741.1 hypothetical protein Cylst_1457 [Cylindrospermum stagnale PCC 7417]